ncbi:unnamed protein product [Heterosigma akashiwo]
MGDRYFYHGRFVSTFFDASPKVLQGLTDILKLDTNVLRFTHMRPKTQMDTAKAAHRFNSWAPDQQTVKGGNSK